jgi:hypothetical protein
LSLHASQAPWVLVPYGLRDPPRARPDRSSGASNPCPALALLWPCSRCLDNPRAGDEPSGELWSWSAPPKAQGRRQLPTPQRLPRLPCSSPPPCRSRRLTTTGSGCPVQHSSDSNWIQARSSLCEPPLKPHLEPNRQQAPSLSRPGVSQAPEVREVSRGVLSLRAHIPRHGFHRSLLLLL